VNELIVTNQNNKGEVIVSGRELHDFLEVKTPYTQWFERMKEYGFEENVDFIGFSQKSEKPIGGRPTENHHIKLDMAKEISMLQRTEKGKQARQYFLQIEKMWNSPEMIMKRALDSVSASKTSILVGDLAKLLKQNGIDTGATRLFEYLRQNGWLISRKGDSWNMPSQKAMEQGLFEIKERTNNNPDGTVRITKTTKVTGKGQVYFINKFLKDVS
jgi:anti-repressor protein